ncbi:MAG: alkylation response protein AidB-like acyl-CoA dehydrogenase [Bermanella sp.]|jgi:alkylation response protein AidB-like acyl-CoA dehydrogenase
MDFTLSDEQQMLKDSVEKFVASEYGTSQREKMVAAPEAFNKTHWQTFADLGWLTIPFSEEQGGFGGGIVESATVMESFGKALVLEPFIDTVLLAGQLLARGANTADHELLLSQIMSGELQAAFAWQERQSRFSLNQCSTTAKKQGSQYKLSGSKTLVSNAAANFLVVSARTSGRDGDDKGISLFVVNCDDSITTTRIRLMDGRQVLNVKLDEVTVSSEALLGELGEALPLMQSVVDEATIALCAEAVGAMDYLYKATADYTATRKQFGQAIGKFQALQHRMVDMFMKTEQCRSLLIKAMCAVSDNSEDQQEAVSAVKSMVGRYGRAVAEEAVQIHGGMGVTNEMNIGHYLKRLMMIDATFGNADFHRRRFCNSRYREQKLDLAIAS